MPEGEKFGTVRKCPACGTPVESFQTRCSDCGYEFNAIKSSETVQAFFQQLEALSEREYRMNAKQQHSEKLFKLENQRIKAYKSKNSGFKYIILWLLFFWVLVPVSLFKRGRVGLALLFIIFFIAILGSLWTSLKETVTSITQGPVITKMIATVTSDRLNMREQPSSDSTLIITLHNGDTLDVIEENNTGNWYKVEYEGNTGYVHREYVAINTVTEPLLGEENINKGFRIPISVIFGMMGAMIIIMLIIFALIKPKWTENDKRRQSMIEVFPIPNSKEDLTEFIILATGKIRKTNFLSRTFSLDGKNQVAWNNIWISKCNQVFRKARIAMKDDPSSLNEIIQLMAEVGLKTGNAVN